MLTEWLTLPGAAEQLAAWSSISGLDLARLGTTAEADEITDTAVTQPLVVAATLLAHRELRNRGLLANAKIIVAGHSVGEIAAYAIAGVISPDDAIALAATRGAEMAKACAEVPTGMSAVLGGDETEVLAALADLDLVPANRNAAGQIVAAGAVAALEYGEKFDGVRPQAVRVPESALADALADLDPAVRTALNGVDPNAAVAALRTGARLGDNRSAPPLIELARKGHVATITIARPDKLNAIKEYNKLKQRIIDKREDTIDYTGNLIILPTRNDDSFRETEVDTDKLNING